MVVVDPHRSVPEGARDALRLRRVRRPHRAGQAVLGVVGDRDGLGLGPEASRRSAPGRRTPPARRSCPSGSCRARWAGRSSRRRAAPRRGCSRRTELGALRDPGLDVGVDLSRCCRGDQRPGLGVRIERAAHADPLRPLDHLGHEARRRSTPRRRAVPLPSRPGRSAGTPRSGRCRRRRPSPRPRRRRSGSYRRARRRRCFTVSAAAAMIAAPVARPPVRETRSTPRVGS